MKRMDNALKGYCTFDGNKFLECEKIWMFFIQSNKHKEVFCFVFAF